MDWFGLGNDVNKAQAALDDLLVKFEPVIHVAENRFGGILHGLLDRLDGTKLKFTDGGLVIEIPPEPRATPVNKGG